MKKLQIFSAIAIILCLSVTLSSCQVVGDIFKAGVWVGILGVAAVVGLIIFIIAKATGGR